MKQRQFIIIAIALAILILGIFAMGRMSKKAEKKPKKHSPNIVTVFTQKVKNDSIPVFVESTGALEAEKRNELYSEVQGLMEADNGRFKAGNSFKKGELLIKIRSKDQEAQLFAQRSSFESALTALMPDLKADYPNEFKTWASYLNSLAVDKTTPALPEIKSEKLKSFITGRGLYTNYHSLKNIEIINAKYNLRAPYDGILISENVDPGTVIRPGQALGVFIQALNYELETSTDGLTARRLKIGQEVELSMTGSGKTWKGKISRIVNAIDKDSQLSTFFVSVKGEGLREGMFLQARVKAMDIPNAFSLSRAALLENDQVYIVLDNLLVLKSIKIQYFNENSVIATGLKDGDLVLNKVPPSAFEGMKVSIYKGEN